MIMNHTVKRHSCDKNLEAYSFMMFEDLHCMHLMLDYITQTWFFMKITVADFG